MLNPFGVSVVALGLLIGVGVTPASAGDWKLYRDRSVPNHMISVKKTGSKFVAYQFDAGSEMASLECYAGRGGAKVVKKFGSNAYAWGFDIYGRDRWDGRATFYLAKGRLVTYRKRFSVKRIPLTAQQRSAHRYNVLECRQARGAFGNWAL